MNNSRLHVSGMIILTHEHDGLPIELEPFESVDGHATIYRCPRCEVITTIIIRIDDLAGIRK